MRAWYSPDVPLHIAWLAFVKALVRNFNLLRTMDNIVVINASRTPPGILSASIHIFRGEDGGDWVLTITVDNNNNNLVSQRGFGHQVVPFNVVTYAEIEPFDVLIATLEHIHSTPLNPLHTESLGYGDYIGNDIQNIISVLLTDRGLMIF
ncbi:hypothetical protein BDN71DRAFT_1437239 [Pleurotus eryngii]|uniref:Uncharacterized protein n=1 Tax=Pleurotus eryngii TaxID=5323 RepID=A0A9P5ZHV1_PLEER|nr:hypothetical protein BDN71DRAFT_1437239 [Pleurotus eryngii]